MSMYAFAHTHIRTNTVAVEVEAGNNMPHDDWVAAIRRLPLPLDPTADATQQPYLTVSYDKCWRCACLCLFANTDT